MWAGNGDDRMDEFGLVDLGWWTWAGELAKFESYGNACNLLGGGGILKGIGGSTLIFWYYLARSTSLK